MQKFAIYKTSMALETDPDVVSAGHYTIEGGGTLTFWAQTHRIMSYSPSCWGKVVEIVVEIHEEVRKE